MPSVPWQFPAQVAEFGLWLFGYPGYLWPWNVIYLGVSCLNRAPNHHHHHTHTPHHTPTPPPPPPPPLATHLFHTRSTRIGGCVCVCVCVCVGLPKYMRGCVCVGGAVQRSRGIVWGGGLKK